MDMGKVSKKILLLSSLVIGMGIGFYSNNHSISADEKPVGVMGSKVPGSKSEKSSMPVNRLVKAVAGKSNAVPDISEWQGKLTDAKVKTLKKKTPFIILRVQYGSSYYDKQIKNNIALMEKYNVPYGVYSFSQYESTADAKVEATDLYNRAKNAKFFVNDYEDQTVKNVNKSDEAAEEWYKTLNKLTGGNKKILLYSYASFMKSYASEAVKTYDGFWLAAYQQNEPADTAHDMWQYTDSYTNSGLGGAVDASTTNHDSSWYLNGKSSSNGYHKVVTIKKGGYNIWGNFNWNYSKGKSIVGQTFNAKYAYSVNGTTYYSLYDGKGNWKGYINSGAVYALSAETFNEQVKVNKKGYGIWGNFLWNAKKSSSDKYVGQVLNVRRRYVLGDGVTYNSLYDNAGNWVGYLRRGAVSKVSAVSVGYHKVVTIKKGGYNIWGNFNWNYSKGKSIVGQTFDAKYAYSVNGTTYYSLYDGKGNWKGYLNGGAVYALSVEGFTEQVKVNKKGYGIWNDLLWKTKKSSSDKYVGQILNVRRRYILGDGVTYYSVYDNAGNWLGYLRRGAVSTFK
ncbi:GH25 family lysozyme [Dellaglioa sp. L3N]